MEPIFNIGTYVRVKPNDDNANLVDLKGKIVKVRGIDKEKSDDYFCITLNDFKGNKIKDGYRFMENRFEPVTDKEVKAYNEEVAKIFIVLQQSCNNFIGMASSVEEANKRYNPPTNETYLIGEFVLKAKKSLQYNFEKVE